MSWNPSVAYGSANWQGNAPLVTRTQFLSSSTGFYNDLQDINLSSINVSDLKVSTLSVSQWISAPTLYISTLYAENVDISGINFDASGLLYVPLVSSQKGIFNITNVSVMQMTFKPTFTGNIEVSFNLGLGEALGGLFAGLGAAVGGALIGVGTGTGLIIQGAEQGIATMIAGRPQNFITQNTYETINFTSQVQVSTLGDAQPIYSTVFRTVSSSSANSVPGREIFTSSFFYPGQLCVRTVSDPFNLITGNSNLNTSTIQSFGQWVPLQGLEPNDIVASTITIVGSNLGTGASPLLIETYGTAFTPFQIDITTTTDPVTQSYATPINPLDISLSASNNSYGQTTIFPLNLDFISTPYVQFQSTFTNTAPVYYLTSSISTPAQITYSNLVSPGNIAICEVDETAFRSTATFDFIAQGQELFIQWGLAVDNLNSTIGPNTAKRVTWDIPGGYSNFIDIPPAPSTLITNVMNTFAFQAKPNEILLDTFSFTNPIPLAVNVNSATFGAPTTFSNRPTYPYQFNGNTYINGTLEAQTIIALSSIFATSTFIETQISTTSIIADLVLAQTELVQTITGTTAFFSTLQASTITTTTLFASNAYLTNTNTTTLSTSLGTFSSLFASNASFGNASFSNAIFTNASLSSLTAVTIGVSSLNAINGSFSTLVTTYDGSPPNNPRSVNLIENQYTANLGYVSSLASTASQLVGGIFVNNYTSFINATAQRPVLNLAFGTASVLALGPFGAVGINAGSNGYNRPDLNYAFGTVNITAPDNLTLYVNAYGDPTLNGPTVNLSNSGSSNINLFYTGGTGLIAPATQITMRWTGTSYAVPGSFSPWTPYTIADRCDINQTYQTVSIATPNLIVTSNLLVQGQVRVRTAASGFAAMERTTYSDAPIWTLDTGSRWESAAQNLIPRPSGGYYPSDDWEPFITVRSWTTPDNSTTLNGWVAYAVLSGVGSVNYWALYRLLQINHIGPPSAGTFDCDILMIPKNITS